MFPVHRRARFHFISRRFRYPPVALGRTEVPLLEDAWSINAGVDGVYCVRLMCRRDAVWVTYTVYYRIPTSPGSSRNVAVYRLGTCPPFAGEFVVVRQTENGDRFLDMRPHDCQNAEHVITS